MRASKLFMLGAGLAGGLCAQVLWSACAGHANDGASAQSTSGGSGCQNVTCAAPPTCVSWQVKQFLPPSGYTFTNVTEHEPDGSTSTISIPSFDAFTLPDGWEPISAGDFGAVTARQCLKYGS